MNNIFLDNKLVEYHFCEFFEFFENRRISFFDIIFVDTQIYIFEIKKLDDILNKYDIFLK